MKEQTPSPQSGAEQTKCFVQEVANAMAKDRTLEAIRVDHKHRSISIARLGKPGDPELAQHLEHRIQQMASAEHCQECALLQGKMDCSHCDHPRDKSVSEQIHVQHNPSATTVSRITCPPAPRPWKWRDIPWPELVPRRLMLPNESEHDHEWKLQLMAATLCGILAIIAHFYPEGNIRVAWYVGSYILGAWYAVQEVVERLQKRVLDVHFLMLAVAFGSASIGAWGEGSTLLFLFSFSGALEHYAMGRTQREIRSLLKQTPKTVIILQVDGSERAFPIDQVVTGMRFLVKPGDQIPVDGEIVFGSTALDESNLTGESVPVEKRKGDTVLSGTMNLWGSIQCLALRPPNESALQRVIRMIQEAQHLRAPSQRFTDRFGTSYTYLILALSFLMFLIWWLAFDYPAFKAAGPQKSAFYRAMTLLVVASPCALVLSIPSAVLAGIAWAAKRGILFRGGAALENLATVNVVAMDKTGTLTTGELQVDHVESYPPGQEKRVVELAFALERLSSHPLARAIVRHARQQEVIAPIVEAFESTAGLGLRGRTGEDEVFVGSRKWIEVAGRVNLPADAEDLEIGVSEVWVSAKGVIGRILLRDQIRPESKIVVQQLKSEGLKTIVLTGDRSSAGSYLQEKLELDEVVSELKPQDKVRVISNYVQAGKKVAMIGDGVNDAPSLAAANVGVAMGVRGSDAALEQADIVLMNDRLENFLAALELSRRAGRIIQQNLVVSLGTAVVLLLVAMTFGIPLTLGVIGHEGSTVVVVLNSLRLLFSGAPGHEAPVQP